MFVPFVLVTPVIDVGVIRGLSLISGPTSDRHPESPKANKMSVIIESRRIESSAHG